MPTTSKKSSTALTRRSINAARARYERGETIVAIAAALKIGQSTIRRYMRDENWTRMGKPAPKTSVVVDVDEQAAKKNRLPGSKENSCAADDTAKAFDPDRQSALVDRIWRVVEKQVAEIERRIGADEAGTGERDARALAVMTRMLRELAALKGSTQRDHEPASTAENDDDDFDRDVDEYCAKVTRMLESMRERRDDSAATDAGNAAADDRADGDELAVSGQGGSVSA